MDIKAMTTKDMKFVFFVQLKTRKTPMGNPKKIRLTETVTGDG